MIEDVSGVYEIGHKTSSNRVELGCTEGIDIQTVTTWGGRPIENGSTMSVYAADHLSLKSLWGWFVDKWALIANLCIFPPLTRIRLSAVA